MGKTSSNVLIRSVGKIINPKSIFITYSIYSYRTLSFYCKLNHIAIPKGKHSFKDLNIQRINSIHSNIKRFISVYKGVSAKYLANYLALFKYIFGKFPECPLFTKGEYTYKNMNFKGRPHIFK
ncbi:ISXO2-like transposase domain-containing protein [Clostridium sp. DSM 8431]|nr:ISXO2-like transposase domain-containing protein [Clostridium sp. DSM 8431]